MRTLRSILCMALGFIVVAAAASTWAPARPVLTVTEKLERYAQAADEYDVLAIGSSLTYRQIIPSIFDEVARESGRPMRLYNLGVDGMRPPEDTYLLEQALALRTTPLAVVLVESNRLRFPIRPQDANTVRAIYWHDSKRLATMARFAWQSNTDDFGVLADTHHLGETIPTLWQHFDYWLRNVSALGRGHEALIGALLETGPPARRIGPDGYAPPPPRRGLTSDETRSYDEALASLRGGATRYDSGDLLSRAELGEKRRIIEHAGARMLLVIPPDPMAKHFLPPNESERVGVLDFSDPSAYPELYDPADRRDPAHLDVRGAERYSRLLARRVVERLNGQP